VRRSVDCSTFNTPLKEVALPTVCVVTQQLGTVSEVWVERQIAGFRRVNPWILTCERADENGFVLPSVRVVQYACRADDSNLSNRWLRRARKLLARNFCILTTRQERDLAEIIRASGTEVLLCHFGPTALQLIAVARLLRIPIVAHFHGYDLSSKLRDRRYRWSLKLNLRRFAGLVVVGQHQARLLRQLGAPARRVYVIPCGVPVSEFPCVQRTRNSTPLRFISVSRLISGKGLNYTLEAFSKVLHAGADAELLVIGGGVEHNRLHKLAASLNISHRVTFAGPLSNEAVRDELQRADVFVQHSIEAADGWIEGFGVSLAEAAAAQLPVIATRCGGIVDQVVDGETGLLVEQRDAEGMAEAMLRLALDPGLRRRLGTAGRERMERCFDTTRQIHKLENVLLTTCQERMAHRVT
jgi:colanic acid/amylovoran biosynthesis glycosyltransferase